MKYILLIPVLPLMVSCGTPSANNPVEVHDEYEATDTISEYDYLDKIGFYDMLEKYPQTADQKFISVYGPTKSIKYIIHPDSTSETYSEDYYFLATPAGSISNIISTSSADGDTTVSEYLVEFDENRHFVHDRIDCDGHKLSLSKIRDNDCYTFTDNTPYETITTVRRNTDEFLGYIGTTEMDDWFFRETWGTVYGKPITYTLIVCADYHNYKSACYNYNGYDRLANVVLSSTQGQEISALDVAIIDYSDYKLDQYGNWVSRRAKANIRLTSDPDRYPHMSPEDTERHKNMQRQGVTLYWTETAEITYYE